MKGDPLFNSRNIRTNAATEQKCCRVCCCCQGYWDVHCCGCCLQEKSMRETGNFASSGFNYVLLPSSSTQSILLNLISVVASLLIVIIMIIVLLGYSTQQ